jgi:hypothetical protein
MLKFSGLYSNLCWIQGDVHREEMSSAAHLGRFLQKAQDPRHHSAGSLCEAESLRKSPILFEFDKELEILD